MKRTHTTIKGFDYTSKKEFERDVEVMKTKGYYLITDNFGGVFQAQEIDSEDYKFTAYFYKSSL